VLETRLVEPRGCARHSYTVEKSNIVEERLFGREGLLV
jgi:hypothetical protein